MKGHTILLLSALMYTTICTIFQLEFKKDCPDNTCETDLHLAVETHYESHDNYFILGKSALDMDITITKSGHPSYGSNLFVTIHNKVQFRKSEKLEGDPEINCGYVELGVAEGDDTDDESDIERDLNFQTGGIPEISENERLISCSFGNPMHADSGVKFRLYLAVPGLMSTTLLPFRINATTLSTETNPTDNVKSFTIEAKNKVSTDFTG